MNRQNNPLVSVIVPVYNVEQYLDECLNSIRQQTYENLEIIVVEDCSTDNSLNTFIKHSEDPRVKLIQHEKNSGLSAARNTGIDAAKGDYIMFVDSDDLVHLSLIELCVKYAIVNDADLITYNFKAFEDGIKLSPQLDLSDVDNLKVLEQGEDYFNQQHFAWLKFIRTDLLKSRNLYFPVGLYYEDWPFHWELGLVANKKFHIPAELLLYRQRKTSITGSSDKKLLDLFKVHSLVLNLLEQYKAVFLKEKFANKVKMSQWSVLTRIDKNLLVQALNDAKKIDKIMKNKNYKYELNIRILIINFIVNLPSKLALKLAKLLRVILKR
ncbi:glycosyltransferase [Acinetobacter haemolyticus]|uniref:glycosyltransferase family 2 protein n=1 Tax=Acinetobacter haemolyticus TaxID=29430 RepID=UPI0013726EC3|nr:glycosyltransferase [Acinetobacter haemolyticus]NAR80209.1 glycosyltransferase [Acinetobacter haemolyticus]NAR86371.1 glycosyltransferase [Acinetobacter haemolyticus]